jgi:aerobic-type carbon monoxide dehydrogenase small subunit (CoxS/CutS family)
VQLIVNGESVEITDTDQTLLDVLRGDLRCTSVKDGCSPQGQCGCCTVLVDGAPRVACVTPVRRVADRAVTTLEGLDPTDRQRWADAFGATGASQCGFCTPGIIMRFVGHEQKARATEAEPSTAALAAVDVHNALAAHLCRCTGWRSVTEAWALATGLTETPVGLGRDLTGAAVRAELEGGVAQRTDATVALGEGGFADDTAPADSLVAMRSADGEWVVAESVAAVRRLTGKRQGRRTTAAAGHPLEVPEGDWVRALRTGWVEPAYLETDAAWCAPGGDPTGPLQNGGAFGAKQSSEVGEVARTLANDHGRPVRVLYSREDAVRNGPKRPPVAAGVRADGSGVMHIAATAGVAEQIRAVAPDIEVVEVDVPGPPTSADIRGAGWVEALVLQAALGDAEAPCESPAGGRAVADVADDGSIAVRVWAGESLDDVTLRSYCVGAAHMALSWVTSEALTVDADGEVHDLTVRSFGVLRSGDTPPINVTIEADDRPAVNGSDAVFAAVAVAVWRAGGFAVEWPTGAPPSR